MSFRNFLILAFVSSSLVACSELKALKKTGDVPDKMDQTNQKLDQTKIEIDRTNVNLEETKRAIHDQQIFIPLAEMLKPENWRDLAPVPFQLMPYGKKLAEAATADELINIFYLWMKQVSEVGPDAGITMNGDSVYRTQAEADQLFHEKIAKLTSLEVIAGFAPEKTVQEILSREIVGDGQPESLRFQETARAFMAMRARFINDVLIKNSIMAGTLSNLGMVETAVEYVTQLDELAVNPDSSSFKFKLSGVIKYKNDKGESVDYPFEFADELPSGQDAPKAWWEKIKMQLDNLPASADSISASGNLTSRRQQVQETIKSHLTYWSRQQDLP